MAALLAFCFVASFFAVQSALASDPAANAKGGQDVPDDKTAPPPRRRMLASEAGANTTAIPNQILRTGINIFSTSISPNSRQLADSMGLTPILERMGELKSRVAKSSGQLTLESLAARQDLSEANIRANQMIQETSLDVDFVLAEIGDEHYIYTDLLSNYMDARDRVVARANAASYYSNGVLWAVGEAFDIPTYAVPKLSIPSGTVSILAGVVPSILSLYAMQKFNGRKTSSEVAPNMLAKLFDYPTTAEVEYPKLVWDFLNSAPADEQTTRTRRDQLIDRWVTDKNIPTFTDRKDKKELDIITGSIAHRKGLSIDSLNLRQVMLTQLSAEVMKMKRLLLELMMAVREEKYLDAHTHSEQTSP